MIVEVINILFFILFVLASVFVALSRESDAPRLRMRTVPYKEARSTVVSLSLERESERDGSRR